MKKLLIANRWKTPDGTLLESVNRHDYVSHVDANGDYYFIDGGNDYVRMSSNTIPMQDCCVYSTDPFEKIRKFEKRGSFVKKDDYSKQVWVPLYQMSDYHVLNCITYNLNKISKLEYYNIHTHLYVKEMLYRIDNNLFLDEYEYTKNALKGKPKYKYMSMCGGDYIVFTGDDMLSDIKDVLFYAALSPEDAHSAKTYHALVLLNIMFNGLLEKIEDDALLG